MSDTYQVNEIFKSLQGEGTNVGLPVTFIRLQGCTVGCPWCDTKYTWKAGGSKMTTKEIAAFADTSRVVITGGEPTIYDLDPLMLALYQNGVQWIQLETSGQNALKGKLVPNWVTWSPKRNLNFETNEQIMSVCKEIKFVIDADDMEDMIIMTMRKAKALVHLMPELVLMPEGSPPTKESRDRAMHLVESITERTGWLFVRYGMRLQYDLGVR